MGIFVFINSCNSIYGWNMGKHLKHEMLVKDSGLTAHELRYLRLVTGQVKNQDALDQWMKHCGAYETPKGIQHISVNSRIARIKKRAESIRFH